MTLLDRVRGIATDGYGSLTRDNPEVVVVGGRAYATMIVVGEHTI